MGGGEEHKTVKTMCLIGCLYPGRAGLGDPD